MANNIRQRYKLLDADYASHKAAIHWYLEHNMYYGCSNIEFKKQMMITHEHSGSLIKTFAQDNFIHYLHHFANDVLHHTIDYPIKM